MKNQYSVENWKMPPSTTGGRHLDGFARLVEDICMKAGFRKDEIFFNRAVPVPGYYRPQKNWDVIVLRDGELIAAIELKSQSGSFGNNFNNRSEEVLGVSRDFWMAYRERLVLERDYTATALLVSDKATASVRDGGESVGALRFFSSLYAHLIARS